MHAIKFQRKCLLEYHHMLCIDHFTVVCLVAWSLHKSQTGVDLILIETSLLFLC